MTPRTRAFLIDDEPLALERLQRMLVETGRLEIAGQSTDPVRALDEIAELQPAVLFLDIEMPGINGFELVARLPYEPSIVFTTAYDQYALKAFEVSSIDYLLKPIEPEDLARALNKLERRWIDGSAGWERLRALLDELRGAPAPLQRIASRIGNRIKLVDLVRVSHFTADDKLTYAVTDDGTHVVDMTLGDLEKTLDPRRFHRIHRASLVNLDYVAELYGSFAGSFGVRLKNRQQSELKVARERIQSLREKLGIIGTPKP
jgi:two-component system LytT family response regulator